MENLYGKITASLIADDRTRPAELIEILNRNIAPPEKISADDIYIRVMYIVSDEVNSYGGCFPVDEHEPLMNLIIDSPVLIGHRKDSLPIARNFHGERVQKDKTNWIKVYFYWLKNAEGAETLKNNIDGGIYKECSISFVFSFPECSICGEDIRKCGHRPFNEYQTKEGTKQEAFFNYRQIEKVLETSIVYRGSVHDTSLTNELFFAPKVTNESKVEKKKEARPLTYRIWSTDSLSKDSRYLVMPAYESIPIVLENVNGELTGRNCDGTKIDGTKLASCLDGLSLPDDKYKLNCRLVGYRGKERQKVSELVKFLNGEKSMATRVDCRIVDQLSGNDGIPDDIEKRRELIDGLSKTVADKIVPGEIVSGINLNQAISKFGTKYGAELIELETNRRYLLTNRKLVNLKIVSMAPNESGYRYNLEANLQDQSLPVSPSIHSKMKYNVGDSLELEASGLSIIDGTIELTNARVVDNGNCTKPLESLELLEIGKSLSKAAQSYSVYRHDANDLLLKLSLNGEKKELLIKRYLRGRNGLSHRYLADYCPGLAKRYSTPGGSGLIHKCNQDGETSVFGFDGFLKGTFIIRPVLINQIQRFLFYRISDNSNNGRNDV